MSRINTNVSSLIAQQNLARSNDQLQTSLTRLSTGLRINSGKDDPAGLIASENLRRDITSINTAISNTQQADQLISTADSALGQISNLLNDVRGLVVQAANKGVLSTDQLAANQLQVDSSLEAIDRIAKVTTFQGRTILDGSLDFTKSYSAGGSTVSDLQINQANLGTTGSLAVDVNIGAAATQASLTDTGFGSGAPVQASGNIALTGSGAFVTVTAASGGAADGALGNSTDIKFQAAANIAQATGALALGTTNSAQLTVGAKAGGAADGTVANTTDIKFQRASDATLATGTISLTNTGAGDGFDITAVSGGAADGSKGNVDVVIAESGAAPSTTAAYNSTTNTLTLTVKTGDSLQDVYDAVNNDLTGVFAASNLTGTAADVYDNGDDATLTGAVSGGSNGTTGAAYNSGTNTLLVNVAVGATVSSVASAINNLADFSASATQGTDAFAAADLVDKGGSNLIGGDNGTTTATYTAASNLITVNVGLNATVTTVNGAINGLADFNSVVNSGGSNTFSTSDFGTKTDPLTGGLSAGLGDDLVVRIAGDKGSEVFNFKAGATVNQVVNAINLVSDGTGVQATNNSGDLKLNSTTYGSAGTVDVEVLSEGTNGTFGANLSGTHAAGTDIVGTINGTTASGKGNTLSINTSTLDLSLTVNNGSSTAVSFTITGGGAVFQLGPQVVTNQQARIGIGSVNTATLGGTDGRLYELRSGSGADLSTDPTTGSAIVDEAINKVTSLRGRLGAFQKTTLETNIASLNDTVSNLTQAQSQIRDADFAAETANLTRAQVLVQSGTQVLSIANQSPQNVLALLRNA
jgi:flagellin